MSELASAGETCYPMLAHHSMNLVETQLWNEETWGSKYVGVVPKQSRQAKVKSWNLLSAKS